MCVRKCVRKGFGTVRAEVRAYGATFKVRFAIALFYLFDAYALKKMLSIILDLPALMSRYAAAPPPPMRALYNQSSCSSMVHKYSAVYYAT